MTDTYLIKYGEIFLKGKNRFIFEDALVNRVTEAVEKVEGRFKVYKNLSRVYVECKSDFDEEELIAALKKVFGITAICPVRVLEDKGFDDLKEQLVKYVAEFHPEADFTFKMLCKRARKNYPLNSQEMNCALGEVLLDGFGVAEDGRVDGREPVADAGLVGEGAALVAGHAE